MQELRDEDTAKSLWKDSGLKLEQLLPSFAREPADVEKLLEKYDATWLVQ